MGRFYRSHYCNIWNMIYFLGAFFAVLSVAPSIAHADGLETLVEQPNGPIDEWKKCLEVKDVCVKESYLTISKVKCVYDMGKCLMKTMTCGYKCVDTYNKCLVDKIFNGMKGPDCTKKFTLCLKQWCMMEGCKAAEYECLKEAKWKVQKVKCYMDMGTCLTMRITKCAFKCVPSLVKCTIRTMWNPVENLQCYITYVNCAIGSCE